VTFCWSILSGRR